MPSCAPTPAGGMTSTGRDSSPSTACKVPQLTAQKSTHFPQILCVGSLGLVGRWPLCHWVFLVSLSLVQPLTSGHQRPSVLQSRGSLLPRRAGLPCGDGLGVGGGPVLTGQPAICTRIFTLLDTPPPARDFQSVLLGKSLGYTVIKRPSGKVKGWTGCGCIALGTFCALVGQRGGSFILEGQMSIPVATRA